MRQSLIMAHGSFATFFTRPISGMIMVVALALLFWPVATMIHRRIRARRTAPARLCHHKDKIGSY